ncbi:MAG: RpiB/LacA/LacB family sugar-phosphate isomerase [Flavobacteriaceae bacterium]|nr:RpiB/LacA/LacB family sugar-phosphate isomerase [Flavobacteriaceae bacterium]
MKNIAIASDHAGHETKEFLKKNLKAEFNMVDFGAFFGESVDYPEFAHPAASSIEKGDCELGILLCGSGNGMQMTANKHEGIRAGLAWNTEIAELARQHNDANMISIPARYVSKEEALEIAKAFLKAEFEGGRHERRVGKISCSC